MCMQSVSYTSVTGLLNKCEWVVILCLLIQCSVISENKVHGDGSNPTFPQYQYTDIPTNPASPNTAPSKHQNVVPQRFLNTSASTFQETVQPIRKIISTGAFVRAFYVFVGLGAIIVMYIVMRTVRLKHKKTSVRKYGILASQEDVELTPLGAEDENEDIALFDMTAVKSRP